jgi:hypothetical protein
LEKNSTIDTAGAIVASEIEKQLLHQPEQMQIVLPYLNNAFHADSLDFIPSNPIPFEI